MLTLSALTLLSEYNFILKFLDNTFEPLNALQQGMLDVWMTFRPRKRKH